LNPLGISKIILYFNGGINMNLIKVVLNSRKGEHYAEGIYDNGKLTVIKNSKLNPNMAIYYYSAAKNIIAIRENRELVNNEGIVIKDIIFNSPSTAAQFVTGRSVNGFISWRPDDKMSLRDYLRQEKKNEQTNC